MRTFELTSLGVAHEAKAAECRQHASRASELKEQLDAHAFEFRRLEESSQQQERAFLSQVRDLKSSVAMYEGLELEVDAAVLREAQQTNDGGHGGGGVGHDLTPHALRGDSSSHGRVRQVGQAGCDQLR